MNTANTFASDNGNIYIQRANTWYTPTGARVK